MASSAWADVVDALVSLAAADSTLSGLNVQILDGPAVTSDPRDFLAIGETLGVEDGTQDVVGSFDQVFETAGQNPRRREDATVQCVAMASNGNEDVKAARDAAFAIVNAVAALVASDRSLGGVTSVLWSEFGGTGQIQQLSDADSTRCLVQFSIGYRARI